MFLIESGTSPLRKVMRLRIFLHSDLEIEEFVDELNQAFIKCTSQYLLSSIMSIIKGGSSLNINIKEWWEDVKPLWAILLAFDYRSMKLFLRRFAISCFCTHPYRNLLSRITFRRGDVPDRVRNIASSKSYAIDDLFT